MSHDIIRSINIGRPTLFTKRFQKKLYNLKLITKYSSLSLVRLSLNQVEVKGKHSKGGGGGGGLQSSSIFLVSFRKDTFGFHSPAGCYPANQSRTPTVW